MIKTIITISRMYGSHGTAVAGKLAMELGVPMFDRKIIELASEKSGLAPEYIDTMEHRSTGSFLFGLASSAYTMHGYHYNYDLPVSYTAFSAQSTAIREIAQKGSCVIIGRCADYILRDDPSCVKVFLYADRTERLRRCMEEFGLDEKAADAELRKLDKARVNYYKNFTGEPFGEAVAHDLSVNTSRVGVDGAVKVMMAYLEASGRI